MIGRLLFAGALALGGVWAGGLMGHGYSRTVARPQGEVMQALEDLDITKAPGAPGTDPSRAGGVAPVFKLTRTPTEMVWTVMSGDKVATRMIADFAAVDATHTKVTAHVERGDAPDDLVSPAFRSKGITMGLFGLVLEDELNALTAPPTDEAGCAELMQRFQDGAFAPRPDPAAEHSLGAAVGQGAKTIIALNAVEGERRRLGCKDAPANEFHPVSEEMRPAADDRPADSVSRDGVRFEPGKPMVDPSTGAPAR